MPLFSKPSHEDKRTGYLEKPVDAEPMPLDRTGSLEEPVLPWVIELRVVGTANIVNITTRPTMLIGRSDESRGIFPDIDVSELGGQGAGVSRRHALMLARDNRVTIQDLGSANGTFINGRVLEPKTEYRVHDRDRLRLGRLELQIHFVIKPLVDERTHVGMQNLLKIPVIGDRQNILIFDESEEVCRVLRFVAEKAGFQPTIAMSDTDFMRAIDENPPDMVIMEMTVGDSKGVDLIRYLRNHFRLSTRQLVEAAEAVHSIPETASEDREPQGLLKHIVNEGRQNGNGTVKELVSITNHSRVKPNIPIAITSNVTGGYQMGQAIKAGADIILSKPIAVDELIETLHEMVDKLQTA
ncbi:MAG: FHA domain-containing protein [Anaerolineae bacterium]|nr:FHA domain-containing protein [Anaerolineae bacterium]